MEEVSQKIKEEKWGQNKCKSYFALFYGSKISRYLKRH